MNTNFIDPKVFTNFLNFDMFMRWYELFLGLFPPATHWLVSAIVLFSIIAAFFMLIRTHWIFIIILIILFPVIYPVLQSFFGGIYEFILYLWKIISTGIPKT